mmetsp:Transcript_13628/g.19988  ORF Transcript_13628/g.19988 Transcript_13628/m.19988 type:complete len:172 (-) Transcript_13628:237-752(-)
MVSFSNFIIVGTLLIVSVSGKELQGVAINDSKQILENEPESNNAMYNNRRSHQRRLKRSSSKPEECRGKKGGKKGTPSPMPTYCQCIDNLGKKGGKKGGSKGSDIKDDPCQPSAMPSVIIGLSGPPVLFTFPTATPSVPPTVMPTKAPSVTSNDSARNSNIVLPPSFPFLN